MSKIPFKKIEANMPGRDNRAKKTPDTKAKHTGVSLKEAVMGRSKLPSKAPNAKRDVYLA